MEPMDSQLITIASEMRALRVRSDERHTETTVRLERIEHKVDKTNGRVNELEVSERVRKAQESSDPEQEHLTMRSLRWQVGLVVTAAGATVAVLKFLGMLS